MTGDPGGRPGGDGGPPGADDDADAGGDSSGDTGTGADADAGAAVPATFGEACEAVLAAPDGEHTAATTLGPFYDRAREGDPAAAAGRAALVRRACPPGTESVLQVGCGVGRLLPHLEEAFGEVVGVDGRPGLLRFAAGRSVRSVLVSGDPRRLDVARTFDAVVALGGPSAGPTGADGLAALLENCHRHLRPGGTVVCDAVADPAALRTEPVRVYRDDDYRLERAVDVVDRGDGRVVAVTDYRVTDRADGRRATVTERRTVRTRDAAALRDALSSAGFAGVAVDAEAAETGVVVGTAHRPVRTGASAGPD
jgi:SAM-dependent methyltransferase